MTTYNKLRYTNFKDEFFIIINGELDDTLD